MKKLINSSFYTQPLHILSYDFGDFYLYENFIVGEMKEDVLISWEDQGELLAKEFTTIYSERYTELKYISNRIHKYSLVPSDWLKFAKCNYNFVGYGIVSYTKRSYFNALLEKIFVPARLKRFTSLKQAIDWAKEVEPKVKKINHSLSLEKRSDSA